MPATVAGVPADIEAGPVEQRLRVRRLDRQLEVCRFREPAEGERAACSASQQTNPVSIDAAHAANISCGLKPSLQIRRRAVTDNARPDSKSLMIVAESPPAKAGSQRGPFIPQATRISEAYCK